MSLEMRLSNSSCSIFEYKRTIIIIIAQNETLHIIVSVDYKYKKSSTSLVLENATAVGKRRRLLYTIDQSMVLHRQFYIMQLY